MVKIKQNKAITLVALVITIIVLIILGAVTLVALFGDNGIIKRAIRSSFLNKIFAYKEEIDLYISEHVIDNKVEGSSGVTMYNVGLEEQPGIETILPNIENEYKDQIIVQQNIMYYKYNGKPENRIKIQWCFEAGIPVWGYDDVETFMDETSNAPITKGEYTAIDGVYVNAPDLTGFNKNHTYYVLYDNTTGNESIGNTIKIGAPEDITEWYNYASSVQKWANVMTKNTTPYGDSIAYWVWIPRYVYKANKTTQDFDIKFVDINNNYKDFTTGEITTYSDTAPTFDDSGNQTNYCLPAAFTWDTTPIPGFWVSKYEVSDGYVYQDFKVTSATVETTDIYINVKTIALNKGYNTVTGSKITYQIYLDNELKATTKSIPYEIEDALKPESTHNVKIEIKDDEDGHIHDTYETTVTMKEASFEYLLTPGDTYITLSSLYKANTSASSYKVYLNNELVGTTTTTPYKIGTGLSMNTEYNVKIEAYTSKGDLCGTYEETVKTTEDKIVKITMPNLKGVIKDNTYYVVYDASGNESIGGKVDYDANGVPTNIPNATEINPNGSWYDYENQKWANIVTIGGDGDPTNTENKRAYWVWIPRYEYKLRGLIQEVVVRFISVNQTTATTSLGYSLPEAFKWDTTPISGYWTSKYEVSD